MNIRKDIVLADCGEEELKSLVKGLNRNGKQYEIKSHPANWRRTGIVSEARRYMNYFAVSFQYFFMRKNYNDILCWQQFYALIFAFYCTLFKVKKTNRVVAFNYTYREKKKVKKLYLWFMNKCLTGGYVDYLHVLSFEYARLISEKFHFPLERIIVTPFGIDDTFERYRNEKVPMGFDNGYVLSIGRSNRDFNFLIDSWKGINYPLIIISDTFKGDTGEHNIIIRRDISGEEQYPWIINCKALIIPIANGNICSGDTVLLKGLSFKKIVLVTEPSTLAEMYIKPGENGLTVKKEPELFRNIIRDILDGKYDYIEENARKSFLENYSRYSLGGSVADAIY